MAPDFERRPCPGRCGRRIPRGGPFACPHCWPLLPEHVRRSLATGDVDYQFAHSDAHRQAMTEAAEWFVAHDPHRMAGICPTCGASLGAYRQITESDQALYDTGVCGQCRSPFVTEDGRVRLPTVDELFKIHADPAYHVLQAALAAHDGDPAAAARQARRDLERRTP